MKRKLPSDMMLYAIHYEHSRPLLSPTKQKLARANLSSLNIEKRGCHYEEEISECQNEMG